MQKRREAAAVNDALRKQKREAAERGEDRNILRSSHLSILHVTKLFIHPNSERI